MKPVLFSILAGIVWSTGAFAQSVPAPGTIYQSAPFDGFPKGYVIGVVLCQDSKHAGKVGLFQGGERAHVARNAREGAGILKARINGTNVFLDVANREVVRGKFVATGQAGRIPLDVALTGPLYKPCK